MKLIDINMDKIVELCKKYKVQYLYVFGSILTNRFNDESDVDLLVRFKDNEIPLLEFGDNFLVYSLHWRICFTDVLIWCVMMQ